MNIDYAGWYIVAMLIAAGLGALAHHLFAENRCKVCGIERVAYLCAVTELLCDSAQIPLEQINRLKYEYGLTKRGPGHEA